MGEGDGTLESGDLLLDVLQIGDEVPGGAVGDEAPRIESGLDLLLQRVCLASLSSGHVPLLLLPGSM